MKFKKLVMLAFLFSIFTFILFGVAILIFKTLDAPRNSYTRIYVQGITCIGSLITYFFLRKKILKIESITFSFSLIVKFFLWTIAGLIFSLIPYFIALNSTQLEWINLRIELVFAALVLSLSAAIFEEIVFRDLILRFMLSRFERRFAFFSQLLLFVGVHFFSHEVTLEYALSLCVTGTLFSLLWELTEDFIAPMVAHAICNFSIMIFNGISTSYVARPGLFLGYVSETQVLYRIGFDIIAVLVIWYILKRKNMESGM